LIKVAVVGFGLSAQVFHLPFIAHSSNFSLVAISTSQLQQVNQKYPDIDVYQSAEQMIRESDADLVIITSPNNTHYTFAKLALECSKHVLLEKPMSTTSEEGLELAALAYEKSLILSIYHNRRWDGDFQTLQYLIKSQSLGEIKVFNSNFDRFRPVVREKWREQAGEGSGILYDLGAHLVDQALHLFGEPQSLTANCVKLRTDSVTVDYFKLMLHYPRLEVVLGSSPYAATPNIRFELQGSKGSYIKHGLDPQEEQLRDGVLPSAPAFGVEPPANYGVKYLADEQGDSLSVSRLETMPGCYNEYYAQLALAINSKLAPPVSAIEGAKVIRILELAMQSHEMGMRVPVDFSEFAQHKLVERVSNQSNLDLINA
jgi:predicted dehydrogenase